MTQNLMASSTFELTAIKHHGKTVADILAIQQGWKDCSFKAQTIMINLMENSCPERSE